MSKKIKITAAALAFTAVCAIAWMILKPPAVECIALTGNTLENMFNETGEVIPVSESDIYTKNGGKLLLVYAAEGDTVNEGDLLFEFDGNEDRISSLKTQKSSLESDRASLNVQIDQARIEEERLSDSLESARLLHEQGALSTQELNNAQSAYELAVKSRELAASRLSYATAQIPMVNEMIESNQNEIEFFAPQGGLIRDLSVKEGHVIAPGTKLCSVYQDGLFRVDCYILVENTDGVNIGDEVEVALRLRNDDRIFSGRVDRLGTAAEDIVSKAGLSEKRVKVEIIPVGVWEGVYPYWPVEVRFITAKAKDCLIAPKAALYEDTDDKWKVWAVRDGKPVKVEVERGVETPSQVEIKGGVSPGEIIVKNSKTAGIKDGKRVKAIIDNN